MKFKTQLSIFAMASTFIYGQITILSTPWPTSLDPTDGGDLWPGGLIAIVTTGLSVPRPLVRAHGQKAPLELAGIRVKVGIGPYRCSTGFVDNPAADGLDAPIIEVADQGDYQQVTVQVPWEYVRYPPIPTALTCDGANQVSVSQFGVTASSETKGNWRSPHFFIDATGYAIAQHTSDLSLLSASNPAHPGEQIILHAINLGWVANPPLTGQLTPFFVQTVISGSKPVKGPYFLDTSHIFLDIGLPHDNYLAQTAVQVKSAVLTPGSLGRYQFSIQLPTSLPPSTDWALQYDWSYCPTGPVSPGFRCFGLRSANGERPTKIHLVSP